MQVQLADTFSDHPTIVGLSDGAYRLYVTALCWTARHDTGGEIPAGVIRQLRGTPKMATELVARGLWEFTHVGWVVNQNDCYRVED